MKPDLALSEAFELYRKDVIVYKNQSAKTEEMNQDNKYSNSFRNFKFFYEKINELGESKLNEISKAFVEKCEVICIRSWNIDQAIVMFNSLNSDGLPLSDSDIILSKLYGEADDKDKFNRS